MKHAGYNSSVFDYKQVGGSTVIDITTRNKSQYKYNGQEFQDELGMNMTAMDFRQYDNALRRFHGVDALVELAPDLTPYRFGFNNPVYWSDPTGLFESWQQAIGYMLSHGLSGRIHGSEGEYWITSGTGNETQNMMMIAGNVFTTFGELLSNVSVSNGGGNSSSGF